MSKVIKTRVEYAELSDALNTTQYVNGYSPSLPTAPGVTPVSAGVTILDSYIADLASYTAQGYGIVNVSLTTTAGASKFYQLPIPVGSNLIVFNTSTNAAGSAPVQVALYSTASQLVPLGSTTNTIVWPCPSNVIVSFPGTLYTDATLGLCKVSSTLTGTEVTTITGDLINVQILWWK
jgi:hypothetical protein